MKELLHDDDMREEGRAEERANTEREKTRADEQEARADAEEARANTQEARADALEARVRELEGIIRNMKQYFCYPFTVGYIFTVERKLFKTIDLDVTS